MLALPAGAAWWFLPFVAPICLWVAWNDMAFMRIPNAAVVALFAVFALIGPVALPLHLWAWQWLHLVVVLMVGFLLNMRGGLGAGDAKLAAAAAPFGLIDDAPALLGLMAAATLAALATHRLARATPTVRSRMPDWASWTNRKFPLGLALGATMLFYLAVAALAP